MQNNQPPVPVNIPQYVYPEDEISLIDLWLVIVKHKKIFWMVFAAVVAVGLFAALVMPKKYSVFSTISIGKTMQNDQAVLLESPETVKAKLENLESWTAEDITVAIDSTAEELEIGMGKVGMPLRVAVTGAGMSPSLDITLMWVGKERAIKRIAMALKYIAERIAAG